MTNEFMIIKETYLDFEESGLTKIESLKKLLETKAEYIKKNQSDFKDFCEELKKENPDFSKEINEIEKRQNKFFVTSILDFKEFVKNRKNKDYYSCKAFQRADKNNKAEPLKIERGTHTYIGARTHRGKTTALISIALDSLKQNEKVYFLTTEEDKNAIILRMIKAIFFDKFAFSAKYFIKHLDSKTAEIPFNFDCDLTEMIYQFLSEYFSELQFEDSILKPNETIKDGIIKSFKILEEYQQKEMFTIIDGLKMRTFEDVEKSISSIETRSIVLLDYIQHIRQPETFGADYKTIQKASQVLTDIAKNNKLCLISGAQLNRNGSDTEDNYKADILNEGLFRESGDIEQDADYIIQIGQQKHPKDKDNSQKTVSRFYRILKWRNHAPDDNCYKIIDNAEFSLFSSTSNSDGFIQFYNEIDYSKKKTDVKINQQSGRNKQNLKLSENGAINL